MCALALQAAALAELRAQLTLPFVGGISTADQDKPKSQASGMPDNASDAQIDISMTADAHNPQGDKLTGSPKFLLCFHGALCFLSSVFILFGCLHTCQIWGAIIIALWCLSAWLHRKESSFRRWEMSLHTWRGSIQWCKDSRLS